MSTYYSTSFSSKNIQFIHRAIIAKALKDGDTVSEIAKELHFSRQAIHSEIKRGTFDKLTSELDMVKVYDPYKAEYAHLSSQQFKGRLSILDDHPELKEIIEHKLSKKHSPEVIALEISKLYQDEAVSYKPCFKTIYNLINSHKLNVNEKWFIYKRKKRNKAHKEEKTIEKPNGGLSIDLRPNISDRIEFGHWEIDCVVGKRNGKSTCLMTLVERKTRYGITMLIPKKSKKCIVNALKAIKRQFGKYFYDIFKSITADNGSEFKDALGMSLKLKNGKSVMIYYAHAYHSWERGSNENYNRMIRRYFPKGTDFTKVTNNQIQKAINLINSYPRKQFGFKTAKNKFIKELSSIIDDNNIIHKMIKGINQ